jgi:cold shock CspA family protein
MPTGTITAFDTRGEYGVIDADDGRLMIFNLHGTPTSDRRRVELGARVSFDVKVDPLGPRAVSVTPLMNDPSDHAERSYC